MGEETNLAHMFQKKLYICNRTVTYVLDNLKLLHTAEEREVYRNIKFYKNAVEEVNFDLLKCDPSNIDFIEALTRAQDNCTMAYQNAVQSKLLSRPREKISNKDTNKNHS